MGFRGDANFKIAVDAFRSTQSAVPERDEPRTAVRKKRLDCMLDAELLDAIDRWRDDVGDVLGVTITRPQLLHWLLYDTLGMTATERVRLTQLGAKSRRGRKRGVGRA